MSLPKEKDSFGWLPKKKQIDDTPRLAKGGESYIVVLGPVEDVPSTVKWPDPVTGKVSEFAVTNVKVPIRIAGGQTGYILVRQEEFSVGIVQKWVDLGQPKEFPYVAQQRGRRR